MHALRPPRRSGARASRASRPGCSTACVQPHDGAAHALLSRRGAARRRAMRAADRQQRRARRDSTACCASSRVAITRRCAAAARAGPAARLRAGARSPKRATRRLHARPRRHGSTPVAAGSIRGLVRAWLDHASIDVRLQHRGGAHRTAMRRGAGACSTPAAATLAACDQLVLANAGGLATAGGRRPWPLLHSRGQVTLAARRPPTGAQRCRSPATAMPSRCREGELLCGATSDVDDTAPELRAADHQRNLARLATPERAAVAGRRRTRSAAVSPGGCTRATACRWSAACRCRPMSEPTRRARNSRASSPRRAGAARAGRARVARPGASCAGRRAGRGA